MTLSDFGMGVEIACYSGFRLCISAFQAKGRLRARAGDDQRAKIKMTHIASERKMKPSLAFGGILIFNFSLAGQLALDTTGVSIMTPALASPTLSHRGSEQRHQFS
jgi:hypothetical protein